MFWNDSTSCDWCFTSLILSRLHKHNCMAGLSRPLANVRKADNLPVNVILKLSILRHDFRYDRQASCLLYIDSGLDCFPFLLDPFLQHYFAVCISLSERQFGVWPLLGCSSLAPHLRIIAWQHRWFSGRMLACHAGGPGSIPGRCSLTPFAIGVLFCKPHSNTLLGHTFLKFFTGMSECHTHWDQSKIGLVRINALISK